MNAKTTRLLKEARPLFWPWCAVTLVALLPLVKRLDFTVVISLIGFWAGIPLLAALPLGNEFQHRTLSLLLAQPSDRMEIWREKLSVTVVALLSTALVFFFVWWVVPLGLEPQDFPFVGVWIIGIFASATFWTLFTRSTLGGAVLNAGTCTFIIIFSWNHLAGRTHEAVHLSQANVSIATILAFGFLGYAGVMLWLGRRTLARFQVTGGLAGGDLLTAGPSLMPESLAGWFRCRATGAVLNLIRKELRLLRPLWLITLLTVVGWTCLAITGIPEKWSTKNPPAAVIAVLSVGMFSSLILAVLAGSLSLGEERTSGTHAWHMTLPVSARLQWLVKLIMALLAGVVCAALLPAVVLGTGGIPLGSTLLFVNLHIGMLYVFVLTFAAFWCACAVNSTVRAALWVFPMLVGLSLAGEFGGWFAQKMIDLVVSRFNPFADFAFTNAVSNVRLFASDATLMLLAALFLVPMLLVAVIQSYRLFRTQAQDGILPPVRKLVPLASMAFLCAFSATAFLMFLDQSRQRMGTFFSETHEAIEKVQPGTPIPDAAHPLELRVEDLAKASPLSERTRRWLRNSRIIVAPDKPHPGPCCHPGIAWGMTFDPDKPYSGYSATIQMASGPDCALSFHAGRGAGIFRGVCK